MSVHSTGIGDDEPLVISPRRAAFLLSVGKTKLFELIKSSQLETYLEGRSRKITVRSIHALVAQRIAAARRP